MEYCPYIIGCHVVMSGQSFLYRELLSLFLFTGMLYGFSFFKFHVSINNDICFIMQKIKDIK